MLGLLLLGGLVASAHSATADESDQAAAIMQARAKFEAAYLKGWESQNPIKVRVDGCMRGGSRHRQPIMAVDARRRGGKGGGALRSCAALPGPVISAAVMRLRHSRRSLQRGRNAPRAADQSKAPFPRQTPRRVLTLQQPWACLHGHSASPTPAPMSFLSVCRAGARMAARF